MQNEEVKDLDVQKFFDDEEKKRRASELRPMTEMLICSMLMDGMYVHYGRLMRRMQSRLPAAPSEAKADSLKELVRREDLSDLRDLSKSISRVAEAVQKTIAALEIVGQ